MATVKVSSSGISFTSALFLLFLGLRLTGNIDWAWYWVASPLLVIPAAILAIMGAFGVLYLVTLPFSMISDHRKAKKIAAKREAFRKNPTLWTGRRG